MIMDNAVIQIRISKQLKKQSMIVSENLGFTTSTLIKLFLANVVKNRKIPFEIEEIPNAKTAKILLEAEREIKAGDFSNYDSFDNMDDAIKFLKASIKSKKKYAHSSKKFVSAKAKSSTSSNKKANIQTPTIV